MKAPRILISGARGGCGDYEHAVAAAGGVPVSAYCPKNDLSCGGLLLCGGDDVDPARFGQENMGSEGIDTLRDQAELDLATAFLMAGKPIFGICRGQQILNVALGGTLIQHISEELRDIHTHDPTDSHDKTHPIRTAEGSLLRQFYGRLMMVNSSHHQALDRLGLGLRTTAWSEGGVVEAVEHSQPSVVGVQFHPERMSYSRRRPDTSDGSFLLEWWVRSCGGEAE